ncbi:hypothetical protein M427DRAFT_152753 [Gonapodya prolifera JEL478]|uniref:SURF1-like protein n=1 Tax=Gonapodya prolifera (strain JEL478) TaxID=1344416 RepID=A0A139ARC3_GONPJ|nr:hypothetical protein M427DRAFT_152753 [Gonapodya prolifera JEL478]|eukprot:KXS19286.1 hypothetical protein M427DRAFT_152753 [Gonapodya prolifera JEL478]
MMLKLSRFVNPILRQNLLAPTHNARRLYSTPQELSSSAIATPRSNPSSGDQSRSSSQRKSSDRGLLFFPIATFALGCWQLYRLQWKLDLIDRANTRTRKMDALDVTAENAASTFAPGNEAGLEYRRMKLTGSFDYDNELYIGPRPVPVPEEDPDWMEVQKRSAALAVERGESQNSATLMNVTGNIGYMVLTPFVLGSPEERSKVAEKTPFFLVIRGYIPKYGKQMVHLIRPNPSSPVTIECLARRPEENYMGMMIHNKTESGEWHWLEREELKIRFLGGEKLDAVSSDQRGELVILEMIKTRTNTPYYKALQTGPHPRALEQVLEFRNKHLGYALTWFSLSATSVLFWYARKTGKLRVSRGLR